MHMSYWFGTKLGDLLFQGFTVSSVSGFICTCLGIVSLAVLFDALKLAHLSTRQCIGERAQVTSPSVRHPSEASLLLGNRTDSALQSNLIRCLINCGQLILFATHEIVSYLLMLIVMTYNGYFTIATVFGAGLGFFIFSPALIEISLRRNAPLHSRMFCSKCIEESQNTTQSESLQCTAEDAVAENSPSGEEAHCHSIEVAIVHSTNEEVC